MASVAAIVSATQAQPGRRPARDTATGGTYDRRTSWKPERSNTTSLPTHHNMMAEKGGFQPSTPAGSERPTVQARVVLKKKASGSFRSIIRTPTCSLCPVKRQKEVLSYDDMLTKMSSTDRVEAKKRNKDHVRRLTTQRGNRCLILPLGSTFAICWDMWTAFWLAFTALVTPFEVAFMPEEGPSRPTFWINRIVDLTFFIDIVLQFFIICERARVALDHTNAWNVEDLLRVTATGLPHARR
jgi:hypothetical protein